MIMGTSTTTHDLDIKFHRKSPDPNPSLEREGVTHHTGFVRPLDLLGLPSANIRDPHDVEDKLVYRQMADELRQDDNNRVVFHLLNRGVTMFAQRVEDVSSGKTLRLVFRGDGKDGIGDGGHTVRTIAALKEAIDAGKYSPDDLVFQQWVAVKIIAGLDRELIEDVVEANNSTIAVKEVSKMNFRAKFEWIKLVLSGQPYAGRISYQETATDTQDHSVIELIQWMYVTQPKLAGRPKEARKAYANKNAVLTKDYDDTFQKFTPILPELLELVDTVRHTSKRLYWERTKRVWSTTALSNRAPKCGEYVFIGKKATDKTDKPTISMSSLLPTLHGLGTFITDDGIAYQWTIPFTEVLAMWNAHGGEWLEQLDDMNDGVEAMYVGRDAKNYNSSRNFWTMAKSGVSVS